MIVEGPSENGSGQLGASVSFGLRVNLRALITSACFRWKAEGYPRCSDKEVEVTAVILGQLEDVTIEMDLPLVITPEVAEYSREVKAGKKRATKGVGRVDIRLSYTGDGVPQHYTVECKCLKDSKSARELCRE